MKLQHLAVVFILLFLPSAAAAEPRMVIPEMTIALDEPVIEGSVAKGEFQILNEGDRELIIEKVAPGWGCSVVSFDRTIPPGGRGKIVLEVNTAGYHGKITKSAVVQSNDPAATRTIIALKIEVTPIFSSSIEEGLSIETQVGKPASRTIILTNNLPKPIKIVGIGHSFGVNAKADLKVIEPGRIYEVSLAATATQRLNYPGHITLDLAGAPVPRFNVDAFIRVIE